MLSLYSLIGEVHVHSLVLPDPTNLLLFRTYKSSWMGKQEKPLDYQYQGPIRNRPLTNREEVYKLLDQLVYLEDEGSEIMADVTAGAVNRNPLFEVPSESDEGELSAESIPTFISRLQPGRINTHTNLAVKHPGLFTEFYKKFKKGAFTYVPYFVADVSHKLALLTTSIRRPRAL